VDLCSGFASAVGAEKPYDLTLLEMKGEIVHGFKGDVVAMMKRSERTREICIFSWIL
jgi:hypothetical protein